ncbi:hypothetical protein DEIGR_100801 [Deinococcus grandis]|uniref:Peptidase S24/S26A/S26B/S26C domain-containing protein n=1 Tax=Deinococcus grandis TaxID=57498 RepID=A0A117DMY1_9DEIO|nr:S24 family peptidase [Deinococcus grandis]BBN95740.1 hypothetical protein DEGR_24730 [Deinococcus grandis]GAQ20774.1 hypothetical protein DEIGR_100801 [Deinococcus grandis]
MPASLILPKSQPRTNYTLPLSGMVQASLPFAPADDDDFDLLDSIEIMLRGTQYHPHVRAFQVTGNSMDDGTRNAIRHGDIVLVNSRDEFNTTRPCLFETPNGYIIKTRGLVNGTPALVSANSTVPPILDMTDIRPCGSVYGVYLGPYRVRML